MLSHTHSTHTHTNTNTNTGLNAKLYWENDDPAHTVSLVPTSAVTGEGVPDLIMMLITLTQVYIGECVTSKLYSLLWFIMVF